MPENNETMHKIEFFITPDLKCLIDEAVPLYRTIKAKEAAVKAKNHDIDYSNVKDYTRLHSLYGEIHLKIGTLACLQLGLNL